MQMVNQVPESRGTDSKQGTGRFRARKVIGFRVRWLIRFRGFRFR